MVLESLFNPFVVKKRPWDMFAAGFLYSLIGFFLSYFVFRAIAGILMVFLVVLATVPLIYTTTRKEEELDLRHQREWRILEEHSRFLTFLLFLFLGITTAFVVAYVLLPGSLVNSVFTIQNQAIQEVNSNVVGNVTAFGLLRGIVFNNLKVLFFCLAFSFLYGTGAIFILTWNASVIAAAVGNLIKNELASTASLVGFTGVAAYFGITTFSFMRYLTHGVFEILAYLVAGLAGGIISFAIINQNLSDEKVLFDISSLVLVSIFLIFMAGIIEVYLTPVLF